MKVVPSALLLHEGISLHENQARYNLKPLTLRLEVLRRRLARDRYPRTHVTSECVAIGS